MAYPNQNMEIYGWPNVEMHAWGGGVFNWYGDSTTTVRLTIDSGGTVTTYGQYKAGTTLVADQNGCYYS